MDEKTEQDLEDAARAGALRLDEVKPEWFTPGSIDPERLDMASTVDCVLGQTFGEYGRGMAALGLQRRDEDSDPLGFTAPLGDSFADTRARDTALREFWHAEIMSRREAQGTGEGQ